MRSVGLMGVMGSPNLLLKERRSQAQLDDFAWRAGLSY